MGLPKYLKIRDSILNDIRSGRLRKGEKLPKREELIKKYSVTRTTVEKALSELVASGVLKTVRRLGTFVDSENLKIKAAIVSTLDRELTTPEQVLSEGSMAAFFRGFMNNCSSEIETCFFNESKIIRDRNFHKDCDVVVFIQPHKETMKAFAPIGEKSIIVNRYLEGFNFVSTNHRQAVFEITCSLLESSAGNSQLFFLDWKKESFVSSERREGFLEACDKYSRFYRICLLDSTNFDANIERLRDIEFENSKPVVMVSGYGSITGMVMRMGAERGLLFGENFLYSDFDDSNPLDITGIRIPSVSQDYYTMGVETANSIKDVAKKKTVRKFVPYILKNLPESN